MGYCANCMRNTPECSDDNGAVSCGVCGKVLSFVIYSSEPTFTKDGAGKSQLSGTLSSIQTETPMQRCARVAKPDLDMMKNALGMSEDLVEQAVRYYSIAVERNFTRGRRREQVLAACLYIACREKQKPYFLIEFSNYLHINIYELGGVFSELCKVLHLTELPVCKTLQDPSIVIHKCTSSLTGGKNKEISDTTLAIIASMNRDSLQTGRTPRGLWGAALYIAACAHGLKPSSKDILRLVHVCGATLSKRLDEFENTESGALTIDELKAKAEELMEILGETSSGTNALNSTELLCQHKGTSKHFAHGFCKSCYELIRGADGGSDPPAFQRAQRQRMEKMEKAKDGNMEDQEMCRDETVPSAYQGTFGLSTQDLHEGGNAERSKATYDHESDNLSDIDDAEVSSYLLSEQEKPLKKELWEAANWEYLEEQAAKEAAAAALKEAQEANLENCSPEARERYTTLLAAIENSKKEKQQKRAADAKNSTPAQTTAEAVHRMLTKKRLSSKINYDALKKLFEEPSTNAAKKPRSESPSDEDDDNDDNEVPSIVAGEGANKSKEEEMVNDEELGTIDEGDGGDEEERDNGGTDYNGYDEDEEEDWDAKLDGW